MQRRGIGACWPLTLSETWPEVANPTTIENFQFVHILHCRMCTKYRLCTEGYALFTQLCWNYRGVVETNLHTNHGIRTSTYNLLDRFALQYVGRQLLGLDRRAVGHSQWLQYLQRVSLQFGKIPTYVIVSIIPSAVKNHPQLRPHSDGVE